MKQVSTPPLGVQILSVGFGPKLARAIGVNFPCQVRSTPLASGARNTVTCPAGSKRRLGVHCKSVAAKSSTMKGAKALASKYDQRRCRTANGNERRVREGLLCSGPRNLLSIDRWKLRQGGSLGRALVFWAVTSPSDVTGHATFVTNRGRSRDAGGGSSVPGG